TFLCDNHATRARELTPPSFHFTSVLGCRRLRYPYGYGGRPDTGGYDYRGNNHENGDYARGYNRCVDCCCCSCLIKCQDCCEACCEYCPSTYHNYIRTSRNA
ncbi:hypothetical protein PRIPAC_90799, partial [Pristionchus pacificus]